MPTAFPSLQNPYGFRRILRVNCEQVRRSDLKVERILRSRLIQHIFELPWYYLSPADRATLDAFVQTARGRYLNSVTFTDPWDSTVYTCRLDMDDLQMETPDGKHYTGTLRLVQISGLGAIGSHVAAFPSGMVKHPYVAVRGFRTVVETHDDFSEKVYEDFGNAAGLQRWGVGGDALSDAQATELLTCWTGNGGPYRGFAFTDPVTSVTYSGHFFEPEIAHAVVAPGRNSIRTTIEELK